MRLAHWVSLPAMGTMLLGGVLHVWWLYNHSQQPLAANLFDQGEVAAVNPKTAEAVRAELRFIEAEGFHLPPLSVSIVRPLGWNGFTAISDDPARYSIVIVDWVVFNENRTRKVVAHELGHVLLAERGKAQSEELADGFAICFGSPAAQAGAEDQGLSANCDEVGKAFQ